MASHGDVCRLMSTLARPRSQGHARKATTAAGSRVGSEREKEGERLSTSSRNCSAQTKTLSLCDTRRGTCLCVYMYVCVCMCTTCDQERDDALACLRLPACACLLALACLRLPACACLCLCLLALACLRLPACACLCLLVLACACLCVCVCACV